MKMLVCPHATVAAFICCTRMYLCTMQWSVEICAAGYCAEGLENPAFPPTLTDI